MLSTTLSSLSNWRRRDIARVNKGLCQGGKPGTRKLHSDVCLFGSSHTVISTDKCTYLIIGGASSMLML